MRFEIVDVGAWGTSQRVQCLPRKSEDMSLSPRSSCKNLRILFHVNNLSVAKRASVWVRERTCLKGISGEGKRNTLNSLL